MGKTLSALSLPQRLSRLWRSPADRTFQPTLGLGMSGGAWRLPVTTQLHVPGLEQMRVVVNLAPLKKHAFWADGRQRRSGSSASGALRIAPANEEGRAAVEGERFEFAQVYIPHGALALAIPDGPRRGSQIMLRDPLFNERDDLVTALVGTLLATADTGADALYRDQLALTLLVHLVHRYGAVAPPPPTGALTARRAKLARDLMVAAITEPISLDELAAALGMSPFHFARCFRRTFGAPPHAYLRRLRMERAKTLLADPALSITDVALACGYGSHSAFTAAFKREVGAPPTAWRTATR